MPKQYSTKSFYPFLFVGDGSGVHIYVIDTGTSSTHEEFAGRFSSQGFDVFGGPVGIVSQKKKRSLG